MSYDLYNEKRKTKVEYIELKGHLEYPARNGKPIQLQTEMIIVGSHPCHVLSYSVTERLTFRPGVVTSICRATGTCRP